MVTSAVATTSSMAPKDVQARFSGLRSALPGLLVTVAIAGVATAAGRLAPVLGAPVVAVILGVLLSRALPVRDTFQPGITFSSKHILQLAVVTLGSQLSLSQVLKVGSDSLPVMIGTLAVCLCLAYLVGRWMGLDRDVRTLIGVGTAICGASAIAAISPVIRARSEDIAYAISTIFLFNIAAVLLFPPIGHLLGLSQHDFGLFAGTAVNDTSSVVAAAASYGTEAGNYAVIVKLTRTLMIIPICLALATLCRERDTQANTVTINPKRRQLAIFRLVPWFLVGFLLVAALNSAALIPAASHHGLQTTSLFLITMAMAGIGLSTNPASLRRAGPRPMLLGLLLWVAVSATSLTLQGALT